MPRLPRLWMPGVAEHLIVRGNNRQLIFRSEGDRAFFHRCMVGHARDLGLAIHAYVFMPNHVHLLATGATMRSLSYFFQAMGRRYVSYYNYLHRRTGTLWEGRFRSFPVQTERYLLTCQRYIELNPVRAGIVRAPTEFAWSSHRFYAEDRPDDAITPHEVYRGLGSDHDARREAYLALFDQDFHRDTLEQVRYCVNFGWALGTPGFCRDIEKASGRPARPKLQGVPRRRRLVGYRHPPIN
jgi:putative transposase